MKSFGLMVLVSLLLVPTHAGDRSVAPVKQTPSKTPAAFKPRIQRDGHSCGYLSLAALYESYGLDPDRANLKPRLGTDRKAVPMMKSTTGTVHPDINRVLRQDGFNVYPVEFKTRIGERAFLQHLQGGHYALLLIKRRQNGHLHWVVGTAYAEGQLTIGDSLARELYQEPLEDFSANHLVSVLLIKPAKSNERSDKGSHRSGLWEMLKSLKR